MGLFGLLTQWRDAPGKPSRSLKWGWMLVHFNTVTFYFVAFFVTFAIFKYVIKSLSFAMIRLSPLAHPKLSGIPVAETIKTMVSPETE